MQSDDADDADDSSTALPAPRSRAAEKRDRAADEEALEKLVQGLRSLNPLQLQAVEVPDLVRDAVENAAQIKSFSALKRHLRHTRALLRGVQWQPLLRRVDLVRAGLPTNAEDEASPAVTWAHRLVIHGDPALALFLEAFPDADRRRLRQFVRNVQRAAEGRRAKARRLLETALRNVMQQAENEGRPRRAPGPTPGWPPAQ